MKELTFIDASASNKRSMQASLFSRKTNGRIGKCINVWLNYKRRVFKADFDMKSSINSVAIMASSFSSSNILGGHYRSAASIAQILSQVYKVHILNIGTRPSPVLRTESAKTTFHPGSTLFPGESRKFISHYIRENGVSAVVAFDQKICELVRPVAANLGVGLVLVKPGGGRPRLYYPSVTHHGVFTEVDRQWVESRQSKTLSLVRTAQGRVYIPEQDITVQSRLREDVSLAESDIAIVRIGRIHEHYAAVNRAAFRLVDWMRREGFPARLIMVGVPQSENEYEALKRLKSVDDAILVDDIYTKQASRILSMFRFNIGTGRGFMEGSSLGQIMFCATNKNNYTLPLLVLPNNFNEFFNENFSPRITPDVTIDENKARILEMLENGDGQNKLSEQNKLWFDQYFSAGRSREIYSELLVSAAKSPERFNKDFVFSEMHLRTSVLIDGLRRLIG